jgi:hypothetical protein
VIRVSFPLNNQQEDIPNPPHPKQQHSNNIFAGNNPFNHPPENYPDFLV